MTLWLSGSGIESYLFRRRALRRIIAGLKPHSMRNPVKKAAQCLRAEDIHPCSSVGVLLAILRNSANHLFSGSQLLTSNPHIKHRDVHGFCCVIGLFDRYSAALHPLGPLCQL